jgi:RHS repeat-associated protein
MSSWFSSALHAVTHPGQLVSDAEHGLGTLVDDGAHLVGGGLSDVGLGGAGQWVDRAGDDVANYLGAQVPEEQLGQTSDPAELVHGDPGALEQAASRLRMFSGAFGETADGLAGIDTGHWSGAAADAFRVKYAPQPGKWRSAATASGRAAGALESFAGTVAWAQGQAREAIALYAAGQRATAAAVSAYDDRVVAYNQAAQVYDARLAAAQNPGLRPVEPGPFSDPGAGLRERAQQVLAAARAERDRAGGEAAGVVSSATDLAPAEPGFWSQVGDDFSDVFQGRMLAQASFGAGILTGAADLVKVVRDVDPMDPWNEEHPAEYLAGLSAIGAGVVQDVVDPEDLVKGVVGTGWGSDPAFALGKLVPNVALAVATDGAGTAADAGADAAATVVEDDGAGAAGSLGDSAANPDAAGQPTGDLTTVDDPVDVATGNVVLGQVDAELAGALPLVLRRTHRSGYRAGRWFGRSWASSLDQRLEVGQRGVFVTDDDGVILCYPHPVDGEPVWPVTGARWPLVRDGDGYTVTDPQAGVVRRFELRSGFYVSAAGYGELPLVSVTSRAGDQISFGYGQDGAPQTVAHSGGYLVRVQVAGNRVAGLVLASAGEGGADVPLARYGYDDAGNLAEVINSSGAPLRFSHDADGRLTGWEDRNGWSYRYYYDEQGRCVRAEGPDGTLSGTLAYDRGNLVTTHTDSAGAVTVYQLTPRSKIAAVIDPLGSITRSEHDGYGRLVSRTDPLGRVTRWSYDHAGNPTAITYPDGSKVTALYNELNMLVAITEPDGAAWRQDHDRAGNLLWQQAPDGAVTRYAYDERGHLAAVTDPLGATTLVECDAAGLPFVVTGPDGATTRYQRDGFGRVTAITGPDGAVTSLTWTTEGRLAARTFPDGTAERFSYDGEGNLIAHVNPAAGLTRIEYGCFDQVAARTNPDGTRTEFGYDHALRLASVTIAGGPGGPGGPGGSRGSSRLTWRYDYDVAGRLVAETDYNGATTRYGHDAAGQLTGRVNGAGQQISYSYDLLGNVTEAHADGAVTSFGYDRAGRLTRAANPDAVIEIERNPVGRVTAETCNGRTVWSRYDASGRRVRRLTPSGAETRWDYDAAGHPVALQTAGQELRFGYDQAGRETSRELPGGVTLAQEWDPAGRLAAQALTAGTVPAIPLPGPATSQSVPAFLGSGPGGADLGQPGSAAATRTLQRRSYRYRGDGALASVEDLLSGSRRLTLDPDGRVTGVAGPDWAESYGYDAAGNITAATWPAPPQALGAAWLGTDVQGPREYAGTLITRAGGVRYQHDRQGRVTVRQRVRLSRKPETWQYSWDADDRLIAVTTPDGSVWRYLYDPLGRRIAKQHLDADGRIAEQTEFTWDGPTLAEQATAPGRTGGQAWEGEVTTWDYQPGTFSPLIQTERPMLREAAQQDIDQRFYAIVTDLIGAPSELTAPDGTLAGYQQRTLWGATLWHPGGASTPLRFPGQYADPETGLHYNHHRYYDPATGRYLSPDPLGLIPAPNPHTYVPNPTSYADPLGLEGCPNGNDQDDSPVGEIVRDRGVRVKINSNDHAPPHAHIEGGGPPTRIGQNGKPLPGDPELTPRQNDVVQSNLPAIRKAISKYMRWYRQQSK